MSIPLAINLDAPFTLLCGGFHHCDPGWNKAADAIDQCYKLYFVVDGSAQVRTKPEGGVELRAGRAYFIPGYQLLGQSCADAMEVYWLHFVPGSLYLSFLLSHVARIHSWRLASVAHWRGVYEESARLFEDHPLWLEYRAQAMLLDITARVLEQYKFHHMAAVDPVFERLQPAIAYMDANLLKNPTLAEIARAVHLAPNYFHRKFTETFYMTPLNYMLDKRLSLVRQLLLGTDLTLEQIAARTGFNCQFHMARMFKKLYQVSPGRFRRRVGP